MNYKTTSILDYEIFSDSLDKINLPKNSKLVINTINPHSYVVAKKDDIFQAALRDSDILLPDGIGIVYASRYLNKIKIAQITGSDLLIHMLKILNEINGKCFFMGANDETLLKLKNNIRYDFPKIEVGHFAPSYTDSFTETENKHIIDKVNSFSPDVLFVGLTAPKQEKWVHHNKVILNSKVFCSIGAVFDFYSGIRIRPRRFWRDNGLEWLIRVSKNPIRLWKRTIISLPIFLKDVMKTKIKLLDTE